MELKLQTTDRSKEFYISKEAGAYEGDSGFDLFFVQDAVVPAKTTVLVTLDVSVELTCNGLNKSCFLAPRSSIYKTPLRMSNSMGVIDSGYRGHLKVPLDNISDKDYTISKGQRLCQLVCPGLEPFTKIILTDKLNVSERGAKGFGSSGK